MCSAPARRSAAARRLPWLVAALLALPACGDDAAPATGGSADISFASSSGSNLNTSPIAATDVGVVAKDAASQSWLIGVFGYQPTSGGAETKMWQLTLTLKGDPVTGGSYAVAATAPASPGSARIDYEQYPAAGSSRAWTATGGTVSVTSVVNRKATFSITSLPFAVSAGGTGNEATGTFEMSGTVTVDDLDSVVAF